MKRPARGVARSGPEVYIWLVPGGLFDFDVIAGVHSQRAISDQHG
jgi:hypothetical protein